MSSSTCDKTIFYEIIQKQMRWVLGRRYLSMDHQTRGKDITNYYTTEKGEIDWKWLFPDFDEPPVIKDDSYVREFVFMI